MPDAVVAGRWRNLAGIVLAQLAAMSTWFSVAAIGPGLGSDWSISNAQLGLMAVAVQIGFVAGGLIIAVLGLADWLAPRRVFAVAAVFAAVANASLIVIDGFGVSAVGSRFLLGAALAGVYPVGMKLMTGWFDTGRGVALGALVAALTVGSAAPHFLAGLELVQRESWRSVIAITSLLAIGSSLIAVLFIRDGPLAPRGSRLRLGAAIHALRRPATRFITLGYVGHMWELYAMWTWIPAYLAASFALAEPTRSINASLAAAVVIGAGVIGCLAGGVSGDRFGHTRTASAAMFLSGGCALACGALFGVAPVAVMLVAVVWGASIIADSAQFSAAVAVVNRPDEVGSVLALQTAIGFAVAALSIQLLPLLVDVGGWTIACVSLSIGPLLGTWALSRARQSGAAG